MKKSRKLLFIKNRPEAAYARSWILDEFGSHSRTIGDATLLGNILTNEQFDVLLLDQRGSNEALIPSIEGMRQIQPHAKLIVVSDEIALTEVKQAMRFNVHDIFLPPFDLTAVVERVDVEVAKITGQRALAQNALLSRWSELASTLEGKLDAVATQVAVMERAGEANTSTADEASQEKFEASAREIAELRAQLEEAMNSKAKLAHQVQQLSGGASALIATEARMRELQMEIEALRNAAAAPRPTIEVDPNADVCELRSALEEATRRIDELEAQGASAGVSGDGGNAAEAAEMRVRELEAELAAANENFEQAGQAFAAEIEQVMAREAAAVAALAAIEEREKKANAVLESAGDAFGRAEETIERDRTELQKQRDALAVQERALQEMMELMDQREVKINERAGKLVKLGEMIEADMARVVQETSEFATRMRQLENRRKEVSEVVASLRESAPVEV